MTPKSRKSSKSEGALEIASATGASSKTSTTFWLLWRSLQFSGPEEVRESCWPNTLIEFVKYRTGIEVRLHNMPRCVSCCRTYMIATQAKTCVCRYHGHKSKRKKTNTDVSLVLNPKGSRSGWLRRHGAGWERQNRPAISRPKSSLRSKRAVHRKTRTSTDGLHPSRKPHIFRE